MESKIKCDRQAPCAKCVSKGSECAYGPTNRKALALAVTAATTATPTYTSFNRDVQATLTSPSSTIASTSYSSRSRATSSSQPNSPSDTSFTSSSSASAVTPPMQTSGLVYIQDTKGYPRNAQPPGQRMEASVPPPAPAARQNFPSSVALYAGPYAPEGAIETYPPPETDAALADELVPVSSHLSPAYGSDVFTPFFTTIFPQSSPTQALNEVTLNIEEFNVRGDSPEDFPFSRLLEDSSPSSQHSNFSAESLNSDSYQTFEVDQAQGFLRLVNPGATQAELQHYCQCVLSDLSLSSGN